MTENEASSIWDDPEVVAAADRIAAQAPPLTDEQVAVIRRILRLDTCPGPMSHEAEA